MNLVLSVALNIKTFTCFTVIIILKHGPSAQIATKLSLAHIYYIIQPFQRLLNHLNISPSSMNYLIYSLQATN